MRQKRAEEIPFISPLRDCNGQDDLIRYQKIYIRERPLNVSVIESLQSLLIKHLRQSTLRSKSMGNPAYLIPSHENN